LGDLAGALLDADFALRESEDNAKAFFRQGQVSVLVCVKSQEFKFPSISNSMGTRHFPRELLLWMYIAFLTQHYL
jgi:hypothetical protein